MASGFGAAREDISVTWWRRPGVWAVASALGVFIANAGGLTIGDDGIGYQATADSLLAGRGLGYFLEPRLTIWPPGWPVLMAAVAKITPLDTEQAAIVLNALVAFAIVLIVHRLLVRLVRSENLISIGTIVSALGASAMVFGHLLMTDAAFAAVTLALFLTLLNYRDAQRPAWLAGAVTLVWAGFMIRYAGVVHIGTVGLWLLADRRKKIVPRLRDAAVFGGLAAIVPVAWVLRNLSIDDTTLGVRYSSSRGLIPNAFDTFATIGNFLVPGVEIERRTIWAAVAAIGCLVMLAMLWRVIGRDRRFRSATGIVDVVASPAGLLVLHVGVYAAYMLYARSTTGLNQLDFRLLNPLYLPLVISALVILDRVSGTGDTTVPTTWSTAARATAFAWAGLNVAVGVGMIGYFATSPDLFVGNYERPAFEKVRSSPALESLPTGCSVSSNLPNALYGSGVDAQWSPRETGLESNDVVSDLPDLERALDAGDGEFCLVWMDLEPTYGNLATLDELKARFDLVELAHDGDVTTYRIEPK